MKKVYCLSSLRWSYKNNAGPRRIIPAFLKSACLFRKCEIVTLIAVTATLFFFNRHAYAVVELLAAVITVAAGGVIAYSSRM